MTNGLLADPVEVLGGLELAASAVGADIISVKLANGLSVGQDVLLVDVLHKCVVVRQIKADKAMRFHDDGRALELGEHLAQMLLLLCSPRPDGSEVQRRIACWIPGCSTWDAAQNGLDYGCFLPRGKSFRSSCHPWSCHFA
eukprot:6213898-Pleurochrysis_carterae.AAC.3